MLEVGSDEEGGRVGKVWGKKESGEKEEEVSRSG